MAPQQIALDSGFVKRHVDSVIYLSAEIDTVFHVVAVDTVEYFLPDAVLRTGVWAQPSPKGVPKPNYDNDYILTFSSELERDSALAVLSAQEGVAAVTPARPYVVHNTCPDDSLFSQQWALFADDCGAGVEYSHIGATEAWDYTVGDSDMIVAVVDVGVQGSHVDLQIPGGGSKVLGDASYAGNHGTRVSGIIGASTNNTRGLAGVNWKTRILAKDANDGPDNIDISKAMTKSFEAVDAGAVVINHSWGGYGNPSVHDARLVNYAYRNDVVTCAAAGNEDTSDALWPAAHPGAISVGAYKSDGFRALFSNYSSGLDLMAPGQAIRVLNTDPLNPYTSSNGTSFASPHVAGAASLLRSYMPSLTNDDVKAILELSAEDKGDPGYDELYGHGLLRVDSAFRMLQSPNTLRQLSVTSTPSVHSVSSQYACPFYDAPGLATAVYFVKKYEVRAAVTFPNGYYHLAGAWGRGNTTIGFAGDSPNFGIGFADFVPGTLTSTGGTIRTYVYEMWNLAGGYIGFRPCAPGDVSFGYSALGEELLATPALYVSVQNGHHRLSWSDGIDFESNWHVDRKEGNGSWQIDFAVLPANSTSFTDSAFGLIGSELYEYRIYPSTSNQTGSNSNVVSMRAMPKVPSCVSGYVVKMNTLSPHPVEYCSACNTSECGGIGGPIEMLGGGGFGEELLSGDEMTQSIGGPPDCPSLCLKTNMLVVEWDEPENQVLSAIEGYRIARFDDAQAPYWTFEGLTTFLADTLCSELSTESFELGVITVDEYGDTSSRVVEVYLTTGPLDYCGGYGLPQTKPTVDAAIESGAIPKTFALHQNHPNPFNAGTVIEYDLPISSDVQLEVFDVLGRRVVGLARGYMPAGQHALVWDGRNSNGDPVSSGIYFYRFAADAFVHTRKLVVLK